MLHGVLLGHLGVVGRCPLQGGNPGRPVPLHPPALQLCAGAQTPLLG